MEQRWARHRRAQKRSWTWPATANENSFRSVGLMWLLFLGVVLSDVHYLFEGDLPELKRPQLRSL